MKPGGTAIFFRLSTEADSRAFRGWHANCRRVERYHPTDSPLPGFLHRHLSQSPAIVHPNAGASAGTVQTLPLKLLVLDACNLTTPDDATCGTIASNAIIITLEGLCLRWSIFEQGIAGQVSGPLSLVCTL